MSTTSPAQSLTLQTLLTIPDPTAQWGAPATKVQVQNASPFIITATIDGETFNIQSFTAQTLPTAGSGASLLILPTNGPAGAQGTLTAVWLQNGEAPPMADGQLTGAAQYAQGLGSTLYAGTVLAVQSFPPGTYYGVTLVTLAPTTRTLIIEINSTTIVTDLTVSGGTTGLIYRVGAPYIQLGGGANRYLAVVQVPSLVDPTVYIEAFVGSVVGASYSMTVFGDTAQYNEDILYTGPIVPASTSLANTALVTGPCRLLTASIEAIGGSSALAIYNGSYYTNILNGLNGVSTMTFPDNTILPSGDSVNTGISSGTADFTVLYAYP